MLGNTETDPRKLELADKLRRFLDEFHILAGELLIREVARDLDSTWYLQNEPETAKKMDDRLQQLFLKMELNEELLDEESYQMLLDIMIWARLDFGYVYLLNRAFREQRQYLLDKAAAFQQYAEIWSTLSDPERKAFAAVPFIRIKYPSTVAQLMSYIHDSITEEQLVAALDKFVELGLLTHSDEGYRNITPFLNEYIHREIVKFHTS